MNKILLLQSRAARAGMVLLLLVIAVGLYVWLYPQLGGAFSIVLVLPIIGTAWYFGLRGAIPIILLCMGINTLTGYWYDHGSWNAYPWQINLTGGIGTFLAAALVARMRTLSKKQRAEITERRTAEGERRVYSDFLSMLNEIVRAALEAKDLKTLLELLADRTGELFSADDCFITVWDEVTQTAVPTAAYGTMRQSYPTVPVRSGERTLTSSTLEAGHALVVEDTANTPYVDEHVAAPFPQLRSALGLPLISGERKLGALILGYHQRHKFTPQEIEQGELAARQISLAMMKATLLEEARHRLSELAGLHAIAQTFTPHGDTRSTFGQLTEIVAGLIGARLCAIAMRDPSTDEFRGQPSAFGLSDEIVDAFHYPAALGNQIWNFSNNSIFRVETLEGIPQEFRSLGKSIGIENVMVAPLWDAGRNLLGTLIVANKTSNLTENDIRLLEIMAGQVAVVVENTRLLSGERRRAKELSVLNQLALAATEARNEDELIEQTTQLIGEQLYPDNFGVMLVDEQKQDLYLHSSYRRGEREEMTRIPLGSGITGWVAQNGRMRCVSDIRLVPDYINADERTLSELCAPLKVGERVIGVINAESARLGAFTRDDENLMEILAGQLAVAIQRLRNADAEYHQTTMLMRSNALIRVLAQVGARAAAASDPAGVMKTLGEELSKIGLTCLVALPKDNQFMSIAYTSIPKRVIKLFERLSKHSLYDFFFPTELMISSEQDQHPQLLTDPIATVSKILVGYSSKAVERIMRPIGVTENIPMCHLPLISEGKLQGILWMWGEGLRESDLPAISIFASQVTIALQNSRLLTEVQRLAVTDEGTGIYNRRHFFDMAEQEFSRARRYKHALSAIIVDIDEFKLFNDRYGHIIGDQILRSVAQALKNNLREGDILGRYGGEEFSILLPFSNLETGKQVAERLCKRVAEVEAKGNGKQLRVTVSLGVAELHDKMANLLELVESADQAMYAAKEKGGNQVFSQKRTRK